MKIVAVVVTYNRLKLLQKTLRSLIDVELVHSIVVVNNGSTDGTCEFLANAESHKICVINQENVGGSGGFFTGMQTAYKAGADYVWCMDDDVFPDKDCLKELLKADVSDNIGILCPRRVMADNGELFVTECRYLDLTNPFCSLHKGALKKEIIDSVTDICGMVFEGPLIKRSVIEAIGYPNKDLFIFYDDTDYSYRAVLAGFKVIYVPKAHLIKERFFVNDTWKERQIKKRWKRLYHVRNGAYFNHRYGSNIFVRYLRPFNTLLSYVLTTSYMAISRKGASWSDVKALCRAFSNGINHCLGKMD